MSNISQLGSSIGRFQNRGDLGQSGSLSERRDALQASQNKNLDLSLTTKEGDTVTLSAGSFMEFSALSYDKSGKIANGTENGSARLSSREMTLASGSQFTFSVKGSLGEQEMDDIENLVKNLDEVINKMSTGNMDDAMAKALEMQDGYDSISGFEAELSYSSSYSLTSEISEQAYYAGSENQDDSENSMDSIDSETLLSGLNQKDKMELPDVPKDSSSRLMDMMLKELEKLREENQAIPRKAGDPVDQLFAHHIDMFKKLGENSGQDNNKNLNSIDTSLDSNKNAVENNQQTNTDMLDQLAIARKGMSEEFLKMMPEARDFRKIASSFFDA